jgi:hypothetical protein
MTPGRSIRRRLGRALVRRAAVAVLLAAGLAAAWPSVADAGGPFNVVAPSISGVPIEGRTLVGDRGEWVGKIVAFTRNWQRLESGLWSDISRAYNPTYTLSAADVGHRVRLRITAVGIGSATTAVSAPTLSIRRFGVLIPTEPVPTHTPTPTTTPTPTPTPTATPAPTATVSPAPTVAPPVSLPGPLTPPLIGFPQAAFRGGLPAVTVRWGGRPAISGTVVRPDGRPVPGARLWVTSRLEMSGAAPETLGWVRTNVRGRFLYLPPTGPSRAVTFAFADSAAVRTASVAIRVVPRITLRFTRAGSISGRVAGAPPGARPVVELQSPVGPKWHTFSTTRLSALDGTFAARPRTAARRVRALIRAGASWPFETGTSTAVRRGR